MKVSLFGHSQVKYLWSEFRENNIIIPEGVKFDVEYFGVPGATFKYFLHNNAHYTALVNSKPDFLIVILGGNDLV